jgi:hypothetical protein
LQWAKVENLWKFKSLLLFWPQATALRAKRAYSLLVAGALAKARA